MRPRALTVPLAASVLGAGTWTVEVQARLEGSGDSGWSGPIETVPVVSPPITAPTIAK